MRNKILKAVTTVAGIAFIVAGSCLDAHSWLPHIICGVSLLWLVLFLMANREALNDRVESY